MFQYDLYNYIIGNIYICKLNKDDWNDGCVTILNSQSFSLFYIQKGRITKHQILHYCIHIFTEKSNWL